jgi:crotonobetainyl-CoA:carnitine CoA-transferase CaiB-like acyl-CoA transferase
MTHQPLEGIRILEIGGYIALPYASSLLASLGAEVVKVERLETGDDFRRHQNDGSYYFRQFNAGKRSLSIDLKRPEAVEFVRTLVPRFDVVLENMRPGKLAAMGLGPEDCMKLNPELVYGSVTGFGDTGPLSTRPAYDTIGHAYGALYSILGDKDSPQLTGGLTADQVTGLSNAAGILAAIIGRLRTGRGQHVQTSILESVSTVIADSISQYCHTGEDPHRTSRHPQAQNFCVRTSDGTFLAVHLSSSEKFFQSLCRALDRPDLGTDPRFTPYPQRDAHYFELAQEVEAVFATRTAEEWENALTREDVPFAPVLTTSQFIRNEQVRHLELTEEDEQGLALVRAPWRFDGVRPERSRTTPRVGHDTRSIASEVLDEEQIESLLSSHVLYAED